MRKVLVRAPNWIGDAVMCLPALEALAGLWPSAGITVLARPRVLPVFERHPAVAATIEYGHRHGGLMGRLSLSAQIKEQGFDMAVLFQNAFDAALLSFLSRIPERVGYARDLRSGLLTKAIPVSAGIRKRHQVFYYLNIAEALGAAAPSRPAPRLHIGQDEAAWAASFLKDRGMEGSAIFGSAPGASYGPAKMWPAERFASALGRLCQGRRAAALVFGGPEDRQACSAVAAALPGSLDLSGELTLRQAMALISRTSAFITNDSGPMHISAALGVATVAVFGSTEDSLTGPLGERAAVVRKKTECSPCFDRKCAYGHYECLTAIGADEVAEAAERLLS